MELEPKCIIVVGDMVFTNVNQVRIDRSVKELSDKAVITLPRNYEKLEGKSILELIKSGDPVTIQLGYDDDIQEEFTGFLQFPESGVPLVLHVDDELYPLKRNNFVKSWTSVTLKQLLEFVAPGYTIECASVNLGGFEVSNDSTFKVLSRLQRDYGFYTYVRSGVLYCQFPYDVKGSNIIHEYELYTWPVKQNNLKYSRSEDKRIRVRVTSKTGGKTITYETGAQEGNSSLNVTSIPNLTQAEVETFAKNWYKSLAFDGYSGTITGFGIPRTNAGDTLKITDPDEGITGNYLIESVAIKYSLTSGFERENRISFKV